MHEPPRPNPRILLALFLCCYALARALEILPTSIPRTPIVALDVLSALAFALVDGARQVRVRGIVIFASICLLAGNASENLSIATGFPFGHYYFVDLMGPKLFHVPILLGLAYIGMAWVSWRVAQSILGSASAAPGQRLLAEPLLAAAIMTSWDLAQDPVWSTLLHGWMWLDGGPWFGVPLSNYFGWYFTVTLIFLLFALYLRRHPGLATAPPSPRAAILFYALCAFGNVLQILPKQSQPIVFDPTGHQWRAAAILHASALVSIFVMGGFVLTGWLRLRGRKKPIG